VFLDVGNVGNLGNERRSAMVRARRRFGQHFLEPAWADKLVAAIEPAVGEAH
jgi:hypothetical protein